MNRFIPSIARALFAAIMAVSWLALLLAELGAFNAWAAIGFGGAAAAGVFVVAWRRQQSSEHRTSNIEHRTSNGFALLFVLVIALATLFLTKSPSEVILGGWDPGVYVHTASMVAEQGTLRFEQPDLASMHRHEVNLVARNLHGIVEPFGGMRLLPDGRVSPQFHHLYPCLMAVFWSLGGIWVALMVNPLINVGCVLALFALASRFISSRWAAAIAALMLALNPAQIWQATFPTAEVLTQFFLLGGFALFAASQDEQGRTRTPDAVMAGIAFGLALFTRYDALLILVPAFFVLIFLYREAANKKALLVTFLAFGVVGLHLLLHHRLVAPYYGPLSRVVVATCGAGFSFLLLWLAVWKLGGIRKTRDLSRRNVKWSNAILATGFGLWSLYAWLLRPRGVGAEVSGKVSETLTRILQAPELPVILSTNESNNMLYIADLFGVVGLVLALVGAVLLLAGSKTPWLRAWSIASAAAMMLLVTNVFNDHFLMWVSRRFVPIVVPFLCISIAVCCMHIVGTRPSSAAWRKVGLGAVIVVILALNVASVRHVATMRDWPGLIDWYEEVAKAIPGDARVYSDQPGFAAPLRFIYGKRAFELHSDHPKARRWMTRLMWAMSRQGDDVYCLTMQNPAGQDFANFEVVGELPLASEITHQTRRGVPTGTKSRGGPFVLYKVTAPHDE